MTTITYKHTPSFNYKTARNKTVFYTNNMASYCNDHGYDRNKSVMRVYCVKTTEAGIMSFTVKSTTNALTVRAISLNVKFKRDPFDRWAQTVG